MALLDRHIAFIEALRSAGMPVSLSEDLDSVTAVTHLGLADREALRSGLAATLVKRQGHRPTFDATFDLFFPRALGGGVGAGERKLDPDHAATDSEARLAKEELLAELRDRLIEAMLARDEARMRALAMEGVEQLGAMPGRGPGLSGYSSYNTLRAVNPDGLVLRLAQAMMSGSDDLAARSDELVMRSATGRVDRWRAMVEADVRRRIAEEKSPEYVAKTTLRPSIEQLAFTSARRDEIDEMRRQIYPLARRLATRLAKEQHARRRGPLDFRRTVRASMSTGGVPMTTHHRPRRPHRTELVVLCDVSGSVANFAQFTLLLVYALSDQFSKVRAFTFVDDVHEVTPAFVPGADPERTLTRLAESARQASRWGRTDYGRAFRRFQEQHADALGPKSSLLILGDARSNYTDPGLLELQEMVRAARHAWWLNPEHPRQWGTGDSAAPDYAPVIPMVECRNLVQLTEFVHDLV
jgi:uncharacterized protein with von Willebrand factor type A (vWA) domain